MNNDANTFSLNQIDAMYINSLVDLVNACRITGVEIDKVCRYMNGWHVTFKGFEGDAICHDGSYGSPIHARYFEKDKYHNDWNEHGDWETIGFPWDYDDVSVHSAQELALYISALKNETHVWENTNKQGE